MGYSRNKEGTGISRPGSFSKQKQGHGYLASQVSRLLEVCGELRLPRTPSGPDFPEPFVELRKLAFVYLE